MKLALYPSRVRSSDLLWRYTSKLSKEFRTLSLWNELEALCSYVPDLCPGNSEGTAVWAVPHEISTFIRHVSIGILEVRCHIKSRLRRFRRIVVDGYLDN
jgi:hypothetical protein